MAPPTCLLPEPVAANGSHKEFRSLRRGSMACGGYGRQSPRYRWKPAVLGDEMPCGCSTGREGTRVAGGVRGAGGWCGWWLRCGWAVRYRLVESDLCPLLMGIRYFGEMRRIYRTKVERWRCSKFLGIPSCKNTGESVWIRAVVDNEDEKSDGKPMGLITMYCEAGGDGVTLNKYGTGTACPDWVNTNVPIN